MKRLVLILVLILAAGCGRFSEQKADFVAYNVSSDRIEILVNNGPGYAVPASGSTRFTVEIQVPTRAVNSPTGPNSVDKVVRVSVAVKNLTTGRLVSPIMCDSGAKVITHITYEVTQHGYESLRCSHSYPY